MEKTFVSLKWKLRVYDAVIISRLLYGLEAIPFTGQDCNQLDVFQYRGLRNTFGIRHSYWSGIQNKHVFLTANTWARNEGRQQIIKISQRFVNRQINFYGHLVRADEDDLMKRVTMYRDGTRRKSLLKRVGGPKTKWHTVTRKHTLKQLIEKRVVLPNWNLHIETRNLTISLSKQPLTGNFGKLSHRETKHPYVPQTKSSKEAPYAGHKVLSGGPVRGSATNPPQGARTRVS